MDIPDRIVMDAELRRNNGEGGTRMYIACRGIVYNISDCPNWKQGLHRQMHFPGQDLTDELPDAPHKEDVFQRPCVKVVGRLESYEKDGREIR